MFKCYRQIEHSDCGLTCIRMIAKAYGMEIPIKHLHAISDINRLGMSIKDLTDCCAKIGLNSKAVRIRKEHIPAMPLPAILFWQEHHFVVLYRYNHKKRKYYIADPAQGKITCSDTDFSKYWTLAGCDIGLVVLVEPNDNFYCHKYEKNSSLKGFFLYLLGFLKRYRSRFLFVVCTTLALMVADLMVPILLKRTIDEGIGLKNVGLVVSLLLSQLAITLGGLVSSNGISYILTKTGLNMHLDMVNRFLEKLSRFPLSFFDRKVSSDFVKKLEDHSRIKDFMLTFPNSVLIIVITSIVFSVLLFHYSVVIFIIFMFFSFAEICWNTLFLDKRKTLDYAFFVNASANQNHAYELTNGMADLKVNNAENTKIGKWKTTQEEMNRISLKSSLVNIAQNGGHTVISRVKELSVTGIGAAMVIGGDLSLGTLMTLGYITGRLSQPFSTIGSSIQSLQDALISYQRVEDVIDDDLDYRGDYKFTEATVVMSGVGFKYPGSGSSFVLKNIDLCIQKGAVIALVGESGCGKSTLIKLMLGFYVPQIGTLKLSGKNVADIDSQDWMRHCGVVMQEAKIFSGSILENITLSDTSPNEVRAMQLMETVGLTDFIRTLPMGIHTDVGVTGIEMSGGQKQRLMIARALYKDPDLLFFDEATSSLDANNEMSIVHNISIIGKGKTVIIAAHRLSTIRNADKIVFLKNGMISETGTHDELVLLKGDYWRLVKNQLHNSV